MITYASIIDSLDIDTYAKQREERKLMMNSAAVRLFPVVITFDDDMNNDIDDCSSSVFFFSNIAHIIPMCASDTHLLMDEKTSDV